MRINKTSNFVSLSETSKIDGYYSNYADEYSHKSDGLQILNFFEKDTTDFVHIRTEGRDKLIVSYINKNGKKEQVYHGELKKKFFEIYYKKKQFFIPLLYSRIDVDRIRIGKTKKGELLINNFWNQSGNILLLAAGPSIDVFHRFRPANIDPELIPVKVLNKWGYADLSGEMEIPSRYDYTSLFRDGVAEVKLNGKWGVIDRQNQIIIPFIYNQVTRFADWGFKVYKNGKSGIFNRDGKEIIPVIYDHIGIPEDNVAKIILSEKLGYINKEKVIIPAIYSDMYKYDKTYFVGERGGQEYLIDKDGYEYEIKSKYPFVGDRLIPDLKTKRKIMFEEQYIPK